MFVCLVPFAVLSDGETRLASVGTAYAANPHFAINATDLATAGYPVHYMINCAHPAHFEHVLDSTSSWAARIGGLRANASQLSHAELDEMLELDEGDPDDLAARYVRLRSALPGLHVIGGCCGTDHRHVAAIANAWNVGSKVM